MVLCPISVSPHGHTGYLFEHFLHGTEPFPADNFPESRPHAKRADQLVQSIKMPHGILARANTVWNQHYPNTFYGDSYCTMNPESYFKQNLGLVISTSISSHSLRAHNKLRHSKPVSCMDNIQTFLMVRQYAHRNVHDGEPYPHY